MTKKRKESKDEKRERLTHEWFVADAKAWASKTGRWSDCEFGHMVRTNDVYTWAWGLTPSVGPDAFSFEKMVDLMDETWKKIKDSREKTDG